MGNDCKMVCEVDDAFNFFGLAHWFLPPIASRTSNFVYDNGGFSRNGSIASKQIPLCLRLMLAKIHKRLADGVNVRASAVIKAEAIRRTRPLAVVSPSTRLDREAVPRCSRWADAVEELLVYRIVRVECQNDGIEIAECHSIDVFGRCNDELIPDLTSSRRRPI